MIAYYFDTSALIKQYVNETGSGWVRQLFLPEHDHLFITSRLTMPEMYSAFARRLREGSVTETSYTTNVRAFERDGTAVYRFLELTPEVVQRSRYLLERYPLRANDAVQLASAVIAPPLANRRQFGAATVSLGRRAISSGRQCRRVDLR